MNATLFMSKWGRTLGKKLMKPIQKYKPPVECTRWNIIKGDKVQVIKGPQEGQKGVIAAVLRGKNIVIVEGINMVSSLKYFIFISTML